MDRRGVLAFLVLTFGITYAVEIILVVAGFRMTGVPQLYGQLAVAAVMWVPGLAAVVVAKRVTGEGLGIANVRVGPLRPYLVTALVVPAAFALVYGLTWALGLGEPDWDLSAFRSMVAESGGAEVAVPSVWILVGLFASSLLIGPTINGVFGFGEELGWRGYLLPKLMPLGRARAYLLSGVIWGLWHAPLVLVGFNYPGYPLAGVVWMIGLTTALGLYIGALSQRHQSTILAGWVHGAFNGQAYGIWRILFPDVNPLLGGMTGLIGIAVFGLLGLHAARGASSESAPRPAPPR